MEKKMNGSEFVVWGGSKGIGLEITRIRVNAVAPSLTDTDPAKTLLSVDGERSAVAERHPLKRFGHAKKGTHHESKK
jgi:3-oxoacyl-[acyl-carrier protein] reductase